MEKLILYLFLFWNVAARPEPPVNSDLPPNDNDKDSGNDHPYPSASGYQPESSVNGSSNHTSNRNGNENVNGTCYSDGDDYNGEPPARSDGQSALQYGPTEPEYRRPLPAYGRYPSAPGFPLERPIKDNGNGVGTGTGNGNGNDYNGNDRLSTTDGAPNENGNGNSRNSNGNGNNNGLNEPPTPVYGEPINNNNSCKNGNRIDDSRSNGEEGLTQYQFEWEVDDPISGNTYGQREERNGDLTIGEYSVLLPDGRTQRVSYEVDGDKGYKPTITYEGNDDDDSNGTGNSNGIEYINSNGHSNGYVNKEGNGCNGKDNRDIQGNSSRYDRNINGNGNGRNSNALINCNLYSNFIMDISKKSGLCDDKEISEDSNV